MTKTMEKGHNIQYM